MASRGAIKRDRAAEAASKLERQIVSSYEVVRAAWPHQAALLHRAHGKKVWLALGYENLNDWLDQSDIPLSRSSYMLLVRLYETFVVKHELPVERLEIVEVTKAREVLAAVRRDRIDAESALGDAGSLSRSDLIEKYRKDPQARLDAELEPERSRCPTCGSWVPVEQLRKGAK